MSVCGALGAQGSSPLAQVTPGEIVQPTFTAVGSNGCVEFGDSSIEYSLGLMKKVALESRFEPTAAAGDELNSQQ